MATKIKIRRGLKQSLPVLDDGEPAIAVDTQELYVGSTGGNILISGNSSGSTGIGGISGPNGADGATGAPGPQGVTGADGAVGATGLAGVAGQKGATGVGVAGAGGSQGVTGTAGAQGSTGVAGSAGTQGSTGIAGVAGTAGSQGSTGVAGAGTQGVTGIQGVAGTAGSQGSTGIAGAGTQGVTGIAGVAGSQGSTGVAGAGIQGVTGTAGSQGSTGIQGSIGTQGSTGIAGTAGSQGSTGVQGIAGTQGTTGAGTQGATGIDGVAGSQGSTGVAGAGTQGVTGIAGNDGSQGSTGVDGTAGIQGATGVDGSAGVQGSTGVAGADGTQGSTGVDGTAGIQGSTGVAGNDGSQGFTGVDGAQGFTGVDGAAGIQGSTGVDGSAGIQGSTGVDGQAGIQGSTGVDGVQGFTGVDGATGVGTQGVTGSEGLQGAQGATGVGSGGGSSFQYRYVRYLDPINGLDTNTGDIGSPWRTVTFAQTQLTDSDDADQYALYLAPGIYDEDGNTTIQLRGDIALIGPYSGGQSNAAVFTGITFHLIPSVTKAWVFENITVDSITSDSGGSQRVYLTDCIFNADVLLGTHTSVLQTTNCEFLGNLSVGGGGGSAANVTITNTHINGDYVNGTSNTDHVNTIFFSSEVDGLVSTFLSSSTVQLNGTYVGGIVNARNGLTVHVLSDRTFGPDQTFNPNSGIIDIEYTSGERTLIVTSDFDMVGEYTAILVDATSNNVNVNLISANHYRGPLVKISRVDSSSNTVTVTPLLGDTLNNGTAAINLDDSNPTLTLSNDPTRSSNNWFIFRAASSAGVQGSTGVQGATGIGGLDGSQGMTGVNGVGGGMPIGSIAPWPTATPPTDWLIIDETPIDQVTYSELFAVFGTQFNLGGEPSGTFRLPPTPGRVIVGAGTGTGLTTRALGDIFGEETHQLTTAELASHGHGVSDPGHAHDLPTTGLALNGGGNNTPNHVDNATHVTTFSAATNISIQSAGSDTAHNNMQPSVALYYIIRYTDTTSRGQGPIGATGLVGPAGATGVAQFTVSTGYQSYIPTITGNGSVTGVSFQSRQDGPDRLIQGSYVMGTTDDLGVYTISLPPGDVVDGSISTGVELGTVVSNVNLGGSRLYISANPGDDHITFWGYNDSTGVSPVASHGPFPNAGATLFINARIPTSNLNAQGPTIQGVTGLMGATGAGVGGSGTSDWLDAVVSRISTPITATSQQGVDVFVTDTSLTAYEFDFFGGGAQINITIAPNSTPVQILDALLVVLGQGGIRGSVYNNGTQDILGMYFLNGSPLTIAGTSATVNAGLGIADDAAVVVPPVGGTPQPGDRYLVLPTGNGDFSGHDNEIAIWNGTSYTFQTSTLGAHVSVIGEGGTVYYLSDFSWDKAFGGSGVYDNMHALTWRNTANTADVPVFRFNSNDQAELLVGDLDAAALTLRINTIEAINLASRQMFDSNGTLAIDFNTTRGLYDPNGAAVAGWGDPGTLNMLGNRITNGGDPIAPQDLSTRAFVESQTKGNVKTNGSVSMTGALVMNARSQSTYVGWLIENVDQTANFTITPAVGTPFSFALTVSSADNATAYSAQLIALVNSNADCIANGYTAYLEGAVGEWNAFDPSVFNHVYIKGPQGRAFTLSVDNTSLVDINASLDQASAFFAPLQILNVADPDTAQGAVTKTFLETYVATEIASIGAGSFTEADAQKAVSNMVAAADPSGLLVLPTDNALVKIKNSTLTSTASNPNGFFLVTSMYDSGISNYHPLSLQFVLDPINPASASYNSSSLVLTVTYQDGISTVGDIRSAMLTAMSAYPDFSIALLGIHNGDVLDQGNANLYDLAVPAYSLAIDPTVVASQTDLAAKLSLSGGAMTGAIDMAGHAINNVPDPVSDQDPATKAFVLAQLAASGSNGGLLFVNSTGISTQPVTVDQKFILFIAADQDVTLQMPVISTNYQVGDKIQIFNDTSFNILAAFPGAATVTVQKFCAVEIAISDISVQPGANGMVVSTFIHQDNLLRAGGQVYGNILGTPGLPANIGDENYPFQTVTALAHSIANQVGHFKATWQGDYTTPAGGSVVSAIVSFQEVANASAFGGFAVTTNNDSTADSNPTGHLYLETGNKTAGNGQSGDIHITTGTSAGGQRGSVNTSAYGVNFASQSQVNFHVTDGYGGVKIFGNAGGEASFSLQPDSVSDGQAGQWIFYTNGSGLGNQNDFAMYNSQLSSPAMIIQASSSNIGVATAFPEFPLHVGGSSGFRFAIGATPSDNLQLSANAIAAQSGGNPAILRLQETGNGPTRFGGLVQYGNEVGSGGYEQGLLTQLFFNDATTNGVVFTAPISAGNVYEFHYTIVRGPTIEKGILNFVSDGATASVGGSATSINGPSGITFGATTDGTNVTLLYTSTTIGFNGTMKFYYERWNS